MNADEAKAIAPSEHEVAVALMVTRPGAQIGSGVASVLAAEVFRLREENAQWAEKWRATNEAYVNRASELAAEVELWKGNASIAHQNEIDAHGAGERLRDVNAQDNAVYQHDRDAWTKERDALQAKLARVEALPERWRQTIYHLPNVEDHLARELEEALEEAP